MNLHIYTREITITLIFFLVLSLGFTIAIFARSLNADTSGLFVGNVELSDTDKEEILWLARIMYSETKRAEEQVLIGWVARNRVETGFQGATYKEVALRSGQFSGLNTSDQNYRHNISRSFTSEGESWGTALRAAEAIYTAPFALRPFPQTVRHFYSPQSLKVGPGWSADISAVHKVIDNETGSVRFAFYDGVK